MKLLSRVAVIAHIESLSSVRHWIQRTLSESISVSAFEFTFIMIGNDLIYCISLLYKSINHVYFIGILYHKNGNGLVKMKTKHK